MVIILITLYKDSSNVFFNLYDSVISDNIVIIDGIVVREIIFYLYFVFVINFLLFRNKSLRLKYVTFVYIN